MRSRQQPALTCSLAATAALQEQVLACVQSSADAKGSSRRPVCGRPADRPAPAGRHLATGAAGRCGWLRCECSPQLQEARHGADYDLAATLDHRLMRVGRSSWHMQPARTGRLIRSPASETQSSSRPSSCRDRWTPAWLSPSPATSARPAAPSTRNGPGGASLRRVEHARRGAAARPRPGRAKARSAGKRVAFVGLQGTAAPPPRARDRHRRTRPRAGRRLRAGLRRAGRRRSRHRQVHPACCRPPPRWRGRAAGHVHLRRGDRSTRCACAPAAWAWPTRRSSSPPPSTCATSPPRWKAERDLGLVVIDCIQTMWLDTIESAPGTVGQVRAAQLRADPAGQGPRLRARAGRPRHQGRRASPGRACWSTWSTRCCISKATAATSSASCAAVKNRFGATDEIGVFEMTETRAGGGAQPVRAVPGGAARQHRGLGGVRRAGGHAAGAGRGAGAAGAQSGRLAPALGGRLG